MGDPVAVVLVAAVTWTAVIWLQDSVSMVGDGVQRAQLRVESIRTGLTIGAAVTGAFALLLAFRRQQSAERTPQAAEYDAGEKRVTELYVKAADQLGSDKGPRPPCRPVRPGTLGAGQPGPPAEHRRGDLRLPAHALSSSRPWVPWL
ncbi:hypothetical protein [Micromonospora sp. DT41]|uniref:hypothetical protein n=1 Tax=Micromonospora sp. DT41 TaxID=3393437 RepID=UPI003CF2D95B